MSDTEPHQRQSSENEPSKPKLNDLLTETRILLPGTEVFVAFLATLPFSHQFGELDRTRRLVYVLTFCSTLLALILFVVPAAYHRIARPIKHRERFKTFANRFIVAGLVPMSTSMILASYLVTYVTLGDVALFIAAGFALLIAAVWWVVPILRAHDLCEPEKRERTSATRRGLTGIQGSGKSRESHALRYRQDAAR